MPSTILSLHDLLQESFTFTFTHHLSSSNSGDYNELDMLFGLGNKKCVQEFGYDTSLWELV
jgi:hypothetical protein